MVGVSLGMNKCAMVFLGVFFSLMVLDFMVLYSLYYVHIKVSPGFSYTHYQELDTTLASVLAISAGMVAFYFLWYLCAFCNSLRLIMKTDMATKVQLVLAQFMQLLFVFSIVFGVYSRHFANGPVAFFFLGIINLYIYLLLFLNWPVKKSIVQFELAEKKTTSSQVPGESPARRAHSIVNQSELVNGGNPIGHQMQNMEEEK